MLLNRPVAASGTTHVCLALGLMHPLPPKGTSSGLVMRQMYCNPLLKKYIFKSNGEYGIEIANKLPSLLDRPQQVSVGTSCCRKSVEADKMEQSKFSRSGFLDALLIGLALPCALAVTPLSAWQQGISTNYGGAQDGLSPDQPSFGTEDVSVESSKPGLKEIIPWLVMILRQCYTCKCPRREFC